MLGPLVSVVQWLTCVLLLGPDFDPHNRRWLYVRSNCGCKIEGKKFKIVEDAIGRTMSYKYK